MLEQWLNCLLPRQDNLSSKLTALVRMNAVQVSYALAQVNFFCNHIQVFLFALWRRCCAQFVTRTNNFFASIKAGEKTCSPKLFLLVQVVVKKRWQFCVREDNSIRKIYNPKSSPLLDFAKSDVKNEWTYLQNNCTFQFTTI